MIVPQITIYEISVLEWMGREKIQKLTRKSVKVSVPKTTERWTRQTVILVVPKKQIDFKGMDKRQAAPHTASIHIYVCLLTWIVNVVFDSRKRRYRVSL